MNGGCFTFPNCISMGIPRFRLVDTAEMGNIAD